MAKSDDWAMAKSGEWPNVAVEAGSDPAEVMARYGEKPASVFDEPSLRPVMASMGEWKEEGE